MISRRAFTLAVPGAALSIGKLKAASVDGKWEAEIESPRGATKVVFDLKSDGGTLTGSLGNDQMGMSEIQDGKVSGDSVSFVQVMTRGNMEIRVNYEGRVSGDEMELTRTMARPAGGPGGRGQGGGQRPGGGRGPGGQRPAGGGQRPAGGGQRPAGGQGGRPGGGGMGRAMTFVAKRIQ